MKTSAQPPFARKSTIYACCVVLFAGLSAAGQSAPTFDAASLRPSAPGAGKQAITTSPGSLTMRNVTLTECIKWAYGVFDYQIASGPPWMASETYDISAKPGHPASDAELKQMLQSMLADRFQLAFHHQIRDLQVLTMSVGKGGPKFQESQGEGESSLETPKMSATGKRTSMAEWVAFLSHTLDQPVIDMTGLTGRYDFYIDLQRYVMGPDGRPVSPPPDRTALLITAFQEQLGLKIESKKSPLDVLVIDRVEKPSGN